VPSALIVTVLTGAMVVALWLTLRVIGLFLCRYLFEQSYIYTHYQIFEILSYILATNLCFTLFKSVREPSKEEPTRIKYIINAAMQAILIGIITLLPNYGNVNLLNIVGGTYGFVSILVSMAILLVALVFVRERIKK